MHGHNANGRIKRQFFAQPGYKHVYTAPNQYALVCPNLLEDKIPFKQLIGAAGKKAQQFRFPESQGLTDSAA